MARDRQRAKARKERRRPQEPKRDRDDARAGLPGQDDEGLPEPQPVHRENVPPAFEHGGEVDEFEAALVAGADGEPETDPDAVERAALGEDTDPADAFGGDREEPTGLPDAEQTVGGGAVAARSSADAPARGRGGSRFLNFLRASWAELQRVQWPDRRQVGQATAVVLGFVIVAGAFLGFADFVASELVDLII